MSFLEGKSLGPHNERTLMALMVVIAPEELANFEFWSGMDITDLSLEPDMMVVVRYRDLPGNGQVAYTLGKGADWAREREEESL